MQIPSTCFRGLIWGLLILASKLSIADDSPPMIVHEWGTFTALQNERGEQLMGINVDTEPVPPFVHHLGRFLLNNAVLSSQHWIHRQKAVPRNHPQVSLRLETPVIYFYPPAGGKLPQCVDVEVKFPGGWLTEFYPQAEVQFPIVQNGQFQFDDLTPQTVGQITWKNLKVGTEETGPETDQHVWLAPRHVAAANVTTTCGEHEKYLFYRGVAQQVAPIRVVTDQQGESLTLMPTFVKILARNEHAVISDIWLMETRPNGDSAYRRLEPLRIANDDKPVHAIIVRRRFSDSEFDSGNRGRLESEMAEALLREGLFTDEAKALLSTWQQAYFVSPGLRVFYTVPRMWTDHFLPLKISGHPRVTRVMIGRVELISDVQRVLLGKLATAVISPGDWLAKVPEDSPALRKLLSGDADCGALGVPIPEDFQIYLGLGRFRNALVAAEEKRLRSANLARFIQENRLEPFRISQHSGK